MRIIKNFVAIIATIALLLGVVALVLVLRGFRPFILTTKSMEPMYRKGSLCWVNTTVSLDNVEIGDALVYRSEANSLVLHRLMDISSSNESSLTVTMKGDAN